MLARSCLRSTRALNGLRNGATNVTKVRQKSPLGPINRYRDATPHGRRCSATAQLQSAAHVATIDVVLTLIRHSELSRQALALLVKLLV